MYLIIIIIIGAIIFLKIKKENHEEMIKEKQNKIHQENIERYKNNNALNKIPTVVAIEEKIKNNISLNIKQNKSKIPYKRKEYITTKNELKLYKILLQICEKYNLALFAQVVLYEIIEVDEKPYTKEYIKNFNKICSKSIDFVIADKETTRIRLCIELDDATHKQKKRIERDDFINKLFEDLQIDLLRINLSNEYDINKIESKIRSTCTDIYY